MAGFPITANEVNIKAGQLVSSLWDNLEAVRRYKRWLDDATNSDAALTALGVAQGDLNLIRPAFADLGSGSNGLYAVAHGVFVPAGVNDFFANAKKLTGTNYAG